MFIYLLIGIVFACDYQSMYANITDTNALIPLNIIEQTLIQPIIIPDTADLTNITLNTQVISNSFTGQGVVTFKLRLAISYTFSFESFQTNGYAIMDNVTYTLEITDQFQQGSTTFVPQTQFTFIGLQQFTNLYSQAVSSINSQIPQQLSGLFSQIIFPLNPVPQTYNYVYQNIYGDQQTIQFNYQSNQLNYTDNVLTLDGQLLISDYDANICQETLLPSNTSSLNQVQLYSISILENIIQYSYTQDYFNVKISNQWKSADFQFYLGSFSNILLDLENFNPLTPVTGWCNLTQTPSYTIINITLNYQCDLQFNTNVDLLQLNMNLTLGLNFLQVGDSIQVLATSYQFETTQEYYDYQPRLYQRSLKDLYIKTILNQHILSRPLFGSGFKTLRRTNPNITLTNDYLILYEQ